MPELATDIQRLSYFFRSLAVVLLETKGDEEHYKKYLVRKLPTKKRKLYSFDPNQYLLFSNYEPPVFSRPAPTRPIQYDAYAYALGFVGDDGTLEKSVVRSAFSWLSRKRFVDIGINEPTAQGRALRVSRIRGDESSGAKVRRVFYLVGLDSLVSLEPRSNIARTNELIIAWRERGIIPSEIAHLDEDMGESLPRFLYLLGRRIYRIKDRKGFGEEVLRVLYQLSRPMGELCKSHRETLDSLVKNGPFNIENLVNLIDGLEAFSHMDDEDKILLRSVGRDIAEEAYKIREGYKRKGWEVKDGLVIEGDKWRLLKRASKRIKEKLPDGTSDEEIFKLCRMCKCIIFNTLGLRRRACLELGRVIPKRPSFAGNFIAYEDDFREVGLRRLNELLYGGKRPYKSEAALFGKVLEYRLNKRRFIDEVNIWLERRGIAGISLENINSGLS